MEFDVSSIVDLVRRMPVFVLVVFRMGGIFVAAPILSHKSFPPSIKMAFSFFLALLIFPTVHFSPEDLPPDIMSFGFVAVREVAVGAIIGFFAAVFFMVFSLAGSVVGRQIGLEMAATMAGGNETGGSLLAFIYYSIATMIFLAINGHHWIIKTLAFSYKAVPLTGFRFIPKLTDKMTDSLAIYFAQGIKMSAPFIIIGLIVLVIVGVVLKVTQQTNMFVLELPLKSLVGFSLLIMSAPYIIYSMSGLIDSLQGELMNLLRLMH